MCGMLKFVRFASLFIYAMTRFLFLLYCLLSFLLYPLKYTLQQIYVVSRFASDSTFSIATYSEKLSSLAVGCGPTSQQDLKLQGTKTRDVVFGMTSVIFSAETQVTL